MFHEFKQTKSAVKLTVLPGNKIERAFLEELARAGAVRVTKTTSEESQPTFTFTVEPK